MYLYAAFLRLSLSFAISFEYADKSMSEERQQSRGHPGRFAPGVMLGRT
jgi:hypothetical protein